MTLQEGKFAVFLAGQYNKATEQAFHGVRQSGGCASYFSFHNMSHFGINDYVISPHSSRSHQVEFFSILTSSFYLTLLKVLPCSASSLSMFHSSKGSIEPGHHIPISAGMA